MAEKVRKRRVTQVKIVKNQVHINCQVQDHKGEWKDQQTLVSSDGPMPSFTDALSALRSDLSRLLEVSEHWAHTASVTGVSITRSASGVMKAQIHVTKHLDHAPSPFNFLTPLLPESAENGADEQCMTEDMAKHVVTVMSEAEKFLDGERMQMALEFDDDDDDDDDDDESDAADEDADAAESSDVGEEALAGASA